MSSEDNLVWHYTNAAGLHGILETDTLWATSSAFMNDGLENTYAATKLTEAWQDHPVSKAGGLSRRILETAGWLESGIPTDVWRNLQWQLLCASTDGDSLTMWRGYAGTGEPAYAIGLDRSQPLGILAQKQPIGRKTVEINPWEAVSYSSDQVEKLATEAMDRLLEASRESEAAEGFQLGTVLLREIDTQTARMRRIAKHPGFVDEREVRIGFRAPANCRFRNTRFGPAPYVPLTGADTWGQVCTTASVLPIKAVRTAPGTDQITVEGLRAMLETLGYVDDDGNWMVTVSQSTIPFR